MKNLLTIILLSLSLAASAQRWVSFTIGEYTLPGIDSIGRAVSFSGSLPLTGNGGSGTAGIAKAISTPGVTFVATGNTLHGSLYIDNTGHPWVLGNCDEGQCGLGSISANIGSLTKITTDSLGNPFVGIKLVQGFFYQNGGTLAQGSYFVKTGVSEDTVFGCGQLSFGLNMNGTTGIQATRPYAIYWRPGHHITEIAAEKAGMLLFDDGTIGTWGGNGDFSLLGYAGSGTQYESVHLFSAFTAGEVIKHIFGGDLMGFVMIGTVKQLWGIGKHAGYLGNAGDPSYTTPHDLTDSITSYILNGTTRTSITAITGNSNCWHALANDSSLWGWGDNGMGSIGNGVEPNLATISFPWFVDPAQLLVLPQTHPVQITKKHNFTGIYGGCLFTFVFIAQDATGQLYACGRNKGTVIPNGVVSCENFGDMASNYPNSWDMPFLTPINPYGVTTTIPASCPGCKTAVVTAFCSDCTIPTTTPNANGGGNQTITTSTASLDGGSSSSTGGKLTYYLWTQTSGAASVIDVPAATKINVSGLTTGTYVYNLKVTDNGFNTANQNVTIIVNPTVIPCNCLTLKKPLKP